MKNDQNDPVILFTKNDVQEILPNDSPLSLDDACKLISDNFDSAEVYSQMSEIIAQEIIAQEIIAQKSRPVSLTPTCPYCGGNCPNQPSDSPYLCDGFAGNIDDLY